MNRRELELIIEVLETAVDNTAEMYANAKEVYAPNYKPQRLAALKKDWEEAKLALSYARKVYTE